MSNFAFVQYTTSSGTSSATPVAFGSNNIVGNIIIVSVMGSSPLSSDTQGASSKVTDSQRNQYYCIQAEPTVSTFNTMIYAAIGIKAGANTVTYNGSNGAILTAAEYSSVSSSYFVCPGGAEAPNTGGHINNGETSFGGGSGTPFTSASEVMAVWALGVAEAPTTVATGTIRWQGSQGPPGYGLYGAIGDDNLASIISSYSNVISAGSVQPYYGVRASVFLNLTGGFTGCIEIVSLSISCSSPPSGTTGIAYTHTFPATGGTSPYTFSISVGSLPTGLTLNTSTGVVSGTPTGTGTSSFTIEVTDSLSNTATAPCSIVIGAALGISCNTPTTGNVGTAYSHNFPASGGTSPYTWSITSGSLPTGLTLNTSTGTVSGTPTVITTSSFTIKVTDSVSSVASTPCSIVINPAFLAANCNNPPTGYVGIFYTRTLLATGGVPPYTWMITSGSLPPGLSLNTSTGVISGTPSKAGVYAFVAQVSDSTGATSSCTISILNPLFIRISLGGLPCN
jgi:hypothetical protein